jgi:signal transduction histidine kinase
MQTVGEEQTVAELDALVTFLQADSERRSSSVARKLHDELGGSVIGAMMDVAWIEQHDSQLSQDTVRRFGKIKEGLRSAIDLARSLVEELRPTLLDSMGLLAALSWQFKRGCERAGIKYTETHPVSVPEMDPNRLIALFRIAQESFDLALQRESVGAIHLDVGTTGDTLTLQLTDDGRQSTADTVRHLASAPILAILHRVKHLQGEATITSPTEGGSTFRVTVPLGRPDGEITAGSTCRS